VDRAAPADQFHTEGGRTTGPNEGTPVLEARIPGTDKTVAQHPHDEFGSVPTNAAELRDAVRDPSGAIGANAKVTHGDGTVQRGADAMTEGRDRAQETGERAANQAQAEAQDVSNQTGGVPETDEEKEVGKRSLMDKMRGYRVSDIHVPSKERIRRTVFLERSSSSFEGIVADHDTLPGPFAPQIGKITGVGRRVGGLVDELVAEGVRREEALEAVFASAPPPEPATSEHPSPPRASTELFRFGTLRRALVRRAPTAPSSWL
jgi:hypothetical protein